MVVGGLDLSGLAFVMADTLVGSRRLWEAHDSIAAAVLWGCVTKKADRRCSCWARNEALATGTVWACDSNLIRLMTSTSRMSHRHLSAAFVTIAGSTNCLVTSESKPAHLPSTLPLQT